MGENDVLVVGKIVGAHGIAGAVKAHFFSGPDTVFDRGGRIRLNLPDGKVLTFVLEWVRPHKQHLLMGLEGITTRNQAQGLVGAELMVERRDLPVLEPGTYYWTDLMGLSVFTRDGTCIGKIVSIIPTGGNDVYVVQDGKKETLIPAVASMVLEIDLETKTMRVDLPQGL